MCKTLCRKQHTCPCKPRKRCPDCFTWLLSVSHGHPGATGFFWDELSGGCSPRTSCQEILGKVTAVTSHLPHSGWGIPEGREDGTRHWGPEDTPANDLPCGFE